jgi:ABC-type uncharacterized transport system substrate-binding protein
MTASDFRAARCISSCQAGANAANSSRCSSARQQRVAAFVQGLRELGWIESRNVAVEYRYGEGRNERFAEIAAELVRLKVDIIVTLGTLPVAALKQAKSVIPIVFAVAGDPLGSKLIASLARLGGNVTGLSLQKTDLAEPAAGRCPVSRNSSTPEV